MADTEPDEGGQGSSSAVPTVVAALLGGAILAAGLLLNRTEELTIVVVSMDTTRPDHLTPYGGRETSPTLDRLAREGVRFTQARSSTSWTLPAHMSLFTGLPPAVHGVTIDFQKLDSGRPIMGRIFQDAGFRTVGLYTAPYVHPRFGFGAGMDFYEGMTLNPMAYDLTPAEMNSQMGLRESYSHQEVTSPRVANRAAFFLGDRPTPRNLLFLHLFDPHYDFRAGPAFTDRFVDPKYHGSVVGDAVMTQVGTTIRPDMSAADLDHLRSLYDAEIAFTDRHLSDVIKAIEREDMLGRTLVVVVSDHGEEFFEDGRFGHRMGLRDEVLRVPMIFWGPGIIPEGVVVDDEVALYDVLPTLMDYADISLVESEEESGPIWGRSLRPLMEGGSLPPRPSSSQLTYVHRDDRDHLTRHDALVLGGLKVIRRVQVPWSPAVDRDIFREPDWSTAEYDVFDLSQDPGEQDDLFERNPDDPRVKKALAELEREDQAQAQAVAAYAPQGIRMDPNDPMQGKDILEQLKAVGYLTGQDQ